MENLPHLHLHITYEARQPLTLPAPAAPVWRGCLGLALREACCRFPLAKWSCQRCPHFHDCLYALFFEKPPSQGEPEPPRPFVLHCPWNQAPTHYQPGDLLGFAVTILGSLGDANLEFLVDALDLLGRRAIGVGTARGRLRLLTVDDMEWPRLPGFLAPSVHRSNEHGGPQAAWLVPELHLHLLSPLDRRVKGVQQDKPPEFPDLLKDLLHRRRLLLAAFSPHPIPDLPPDVAHCLPQVPHIKLTGPPPRWRRGNRYSRRKNERQSLSGLMGHLTYTDVSAPLVSLLADWVPAHLCKGTAFGLGAFALQVGELWVAPPFWQTPLIL